MANHFPVGLAMVCAIAGRFAVGQMYDPNSLTPQYISNPTHIDIMAAEHSAFQHGCRAAEAMSGHDSWAVIREQEAADRARQDATMMRMQMEDNDRRERFCREQARQQEEEEWRLQQQRQNEFWDSPEGKEQQALWIEALKQREAREEAEFQSWMKNLSKLFPISSTRRFDMWWMRVRNHVMQGHTTSEERKLKKRVEEYFKQARRDYVLGGRGKRVDSSAQNVPRQKVESQKVGARNARNSKKKGVNLEAHGNSSKELFVSACVEEAESEHFGALSDEERLAVIEKATAMWESNHKSVNSQK